MPVGLEKLPASPELHIVIGATVAVGNFSNCYDSVTLHKIDSAILNHYSRVALRANRFNLRELTNRGHFYR